MIVTTIKLDSCNKDYYIKWILYNFFAWIKWAQHCRIKVFVELQRKIRRHYDAILATMEYHLTNAVVEATNRKIKLSIYMAYGFRNIDNMLDMIMLRCSDIEVRLPWEHNPVLPVEA